ncbi:hypothetical protein ACOSP7_001016 [Xanthoceras sorbifolium]
MKKQVSSSTVFLVVCLIFLVTNFLSTCNPSGNIRGRKAPPDQCNQDNDSDCCKQGKLYPIYRCSPSVSGHTKATLTINSFAKGGDGGGPSECDNQYHPDDTPVVALSTGWYNKVIMTISLLVITTLLMPPCSVWEALGVSESSDDWGYMDIYWSDA